ncbi:MAG: two pore domain potassium channel family protein [Candidatus Fermentibacteraceae bacterium]|nr:two pore domain potassium channel family protein [Candidatus Fermentibacteraceae bacterium]
MDFLPIRFTLKFLELFVTGLFMISPVLLFLVGILFLLAKITCNIEKWQSFSKSLYFTFITALTVGYGKTVPGSRWGRLLSVLSAFVGIVLTGVIVSVALNSVMISWQFTHNTPMETSIESELQNLEGTGFRPWEKKTGSGDTTGVARADSLSSEAENLVNSADSLSHIADSLRN